MSEENKALRYKFDQSEAIRPSSSLSFSFEPVLRV